MTPVWKVDPVNPDPAVIARAADLVRAGKLVAMPTETVYGLAANALDETAVGAIFASKGRPSTNPLIVHIDTEADVKRVAADFPEPARRLAAKFWPGPLSIVLPKGPDVPDAVTAGGPTVAVRCPAHAVARALIREAGVPLAAPSANRSNELSPTRAEHVLKSLDGRIDAILDAGPCEVGIESTVVEITDDGLKILRPGTLINEFMQPGGFSVVVDEQLFHGVPAKSPGLSSIHYAPRTPFYPCIVKSALEKIINARTFQKRFAVIDIKGTRLTWREKAERIDVSLPAEASACAAIFYETLHTLDEMDLEAIYFVIPSGGFEWAAISNRVQRASSWQMSSNKTTTAPFQNFFVTPE